MCWYASSLFCPAVERVDARDGLALMPTSLSTLLYSVEQNLNPRLAVMLVR